LTENITENDNNCNTNDDEDVHSLELNEDFNDFSINEINEEKIMSYVSELKSNKSSEDDDISPKMIKKHYLYSCLTFFV
jgi:hypothetical protein